MKFEDSIALARYIFDKTGCEPDDAANNSVIPNEYRDQIQEILEGERTIELIPAEVFSDGSEDPRWLDKSDRDAWYYWPRLREHLIGDKQWPLDRVNSLDDSSDSVLRHLSPPEKENFDVRGLVLGYVQSGKTANYTALIAKAADVGYRLFIVLSGMDNGLRRQTQIRLEQELVGHPEISSNAVPLPELGKQWHTFTTRDIDGDFQQGNVNTATLQGTQPVLLVVKKNGAVLRRVINWLREADSNTIAQIPALIIDDEADQASIDTTGTYIVEGEESSDDYEPPTVINGLIRTLLEKFPRCSLVSYTATPFANILIPADKVNPEFGPDLYPRNFIISLPKPRLYFGAEELFGRASFTGEEDAGAGIDVFRPIPAEEVTSWEANQRAPESLRSAIFDFALAGAAKAKREEETSEKPAAMLVHTSHLTSEHNVAEKIVRTALQEIRDQWRYRKNDCIKDEMRPRWNEGFYPTTNSYDSSKTVNFDELHDLIGEFLESVQVKTINSNRGDILDYEEEPDAKTIIIGGNKLSRGLTIEGLLVSYFTRKSQSPMYDTVMQMGRWFGYRESYVDLTRLYMTDDLADIFGHLSLVEHRLREDLIIYSNRKGITPKDIGMRILAHPSMRVTNKAKGRYARELGSSYSGVFFQTFRFPWDDPEELARSASKTLEATKCLLVDLDDPEQEKNHLIWRNACSDRIIDFLHNVENREHSDEIQDIIRYINQRKKDEELSTWTVAVSHLQKRDDHLGTADWGINKDINQISRTRLMKKMNSLGVITDPADENIGLSENQIEVARQQLEGHGGLVKDSAIKRLARSPDEGLLVLYPISKYSKPDSKKKNRAPIYEDPDNELAHDLIGFSIPFPLSPKSTSEKYVHAIPGWNRDDE